LTLEDLGRVNIFIGENGVGKTTVLEAVYLIAHPQDPERLTQLGRLRNLPAPNFDGDDALATLFLNRESSQWPEFQFVANDQSHRLAITALKRNRAEEVEVLVLGQMDAIPNIPSLHGIKVAYSKDSNHEQYYELTMHPSLPMTVRGTRSDNGLGCYYLHAGWSSAAQDTANVLTMLQEKKRSANFLELVKAVEPRAVNILPGVRGSSPMVFVDVGLPKLLPIDVLGDGLCRVVLMATGLYAADAELFAADEIDAGLHFSVMPQVWKGICALAGNESKQVFCTTHNEEMLMNTLDAFADAPEMLRIFRIDRMRDGRVEATKYTYGDFRNADLASLDIR
jgi:ABC-type glutathione transport system ATPase component